MVFVGGDPDHEEIGSKTKRVKPVANPPVEQVIRTSDPFDDDRELCAGQCPATSLWGWYRVTDYNPDTRSARSCKRVRVCEGDEAAQLEDYFSREAFQLLPCKVGAEIPALIAY